MVYLVEIKGPNHHLVFVYHDFDLYWITFYNHQIVLYIHATSLKHKH